MNVKRPALILGLLGAPLLVASALGQQFGGQPSNNSVRQPGTRSSRPDSAANPFGGQAPDGFSGANLARPRYWLGQSDRRNTAYQPDASGADNEERNLSGAVEELAGKLGENLSEGARSDIKTQLTQVLEKQFDLRQKRHKLEMDELDARIKKLKDLVAKRQENRREIVAKRLDQILSNAEGLGW